MKRIILLIILSILAFTDSLKAQPYSKIKPSEFDIMKYRSTPPITLTDVLGLSEAQVIKRYGKPGSVEIHEDEGEGRLKRFRYPGMNVEFDDEYCEVWFDLTGNTFGLVVRKKGSLTAGLNDVVIRVGDALTKPHGVSTVFPESYKARGQGQVYIQMTTEKGVPVDCSIVIDYDAKSNMVRNIWVGCDASTL